MKNPRFTIIQTFSLGVFLILLAASGYSQTVTFSNIWYIAPLSRAYVGNGANERGVAINPVNRHVYIVSRSTTPATIKILNGDDGTEVGNLDITGITGGNGNANNLISVADDGTIYVCNLVTAGSFKVYSWATEASTPVVAFGPGLSALRWGDSFRVRGSGTNTQIAASGSGNPNVAILTTTDGVTFTATEIPLTSGGLPAGDASKAIAFGPTNSMYFKQASANLRFVNFNLVAKTFTLIRTITVDTSMIGMVVDNTNNYVAGVLGANSTTTASHRCKFYDISIPTAPSLLLDTNYPPVTYANGNATAYADNVSDLVACLDTSNGLLVFKKIIVAGAVAPTITGQPQGSAVLQGGYYTLAVAGTGSQPRYYQWSITTNSVTSAVTAQTTNSSLLLTNVTPAFAGGYTVVISNSAGSITSSVANITITPTVTSSVATQLWTLSPGSRPYISTDGTQRSVGYNAVNDHLVFVSRTPVSAIYVLSAATGADINTMSLSGVSFGTFDINLAGVADDGVVYGANLVTTGSAGYKIYRWDNDSAATIPTTIYGTGNASSPEQSQRWGDTFDVRGAGTNTQILAGEQAGGKVAIFTTTDGTNFNLHLIATDATSEITRLGLAFGYGNTYWSKSSGTPAQNVV